MNGGGPPSFYIMPSPSITTLFLVHLDKITQTLRGTIHATGPKKPTLTEQESGQVK